MNTLELCFPSISRKEVGILVLPIKQQIQRGQKGLPRMSGVHLQETLEERLRDSLGQGAQNQVRAWRVPRAICSNPCSPLSEAQHLSSRISLYSPVGRHPDKFYTPLGFSISVLLLKHQKLPSLQPSSSYLFQDYGLARISYSSSPMMSLKTVLGRPVSSKTKSPLRMISPKTQTFFQKACIGLLLIFQGPERGRLKEPSVLGLWAACSASGDTLRGH